MKAVKSCVPASASAQACSAGKSTRCGHQSARVRSNGDGARAGEHAVEVGARERVVARGEAVGHLLGLEDRDLVGQQRVDRAQRRRRAGIGDDLAERVHAAIGAARDRQVDGLAQDRLQRALELGRHGAPAGLRGPAGEGRPVVLEGELGGQAQWG